MFFQLYVRSICKLLLWTFPVSGHIALLLLVVSFSFCLRSLWAQILEVLSLFLICFPLLGLYEEYSLTRCSSMLFSRMNQFCKVSIFIQLLQQLCGQPVFNLSFYSTSIHCGCLTSTRKCPKMAVLLWTGSKSARWHKSLCT